MYRPSSPLTPARKSGLIYSLEKFNMEMKLPEDRRTLSESFLTGNMVIFGSVRNPKPLREGNEILRIRLLTIQYK